MGWSMNMSIGWPNNTSGGTIPNATLYAQESAPGLFTPTTDEFTIDIWIKISSYQIGYRTILQFDNNPYNGLGIDNGYVSFNINDTTLLVSSSQIPRDKWTLISVASNGVDGNLWINGSLKNLSLGTFLVSNGNIFIGSNGSLPVLQCLLTGFRFSNVLEYAMNTNFDTPIGPFVVNSNCLLLCLQGNILPLLLTDESDYNNTLINNTGIYNIDNPFNGTLVQGSLQLG